MKSRGLGDSIAKFKKYSREEMQEGNKNLPWEAEAYSKTDPYEKY